MSAKYSFIQGSEGVFTLYEDGLLLARFTRGTFREVLTTQLGRSSNWVGSILRLFLRKYPSPLTLCIRSHIERAVDRFGEDGLAEYLRSKGFRVAKTIKDVSDEEIVSYLESKGYIIEGLLSGCYYNSQEKLKKSTVI